MTSEDELCFLSAVEIGFRFAARTLSPVELMEAVLARAARLDPVLCFFAEPMFESAMASAHQAHAALRGGITLAPLHGLPITIKDNVAVAGVPMRVGSHALPVSHPTVDGLTVQRVRRAGAIPIGKTTLPEFAHKVLTDNLVDGFTRSPWNLDRTPGGSSGGAAAALAAGVGPLAIGTDGGGSIRCPASCTSTVGLKPTLGRVPNETAPDAFGNFFYVGPMARTVADVRLLLSIIAGPCGADPYSSIIVFDGRGPSAKRPRIGFVEHFGDERTAGEVVSLARNAMDHLASTGAYVDLLRPGCFSGLFPTYKILATTAHATRFGHLADRASDRLTDSMRDSIKIGRGWTAVDLLRAQDRRTALYRDVQALFDEVDVIATPALTAPPPRLAAGGSIATEAFGTWAAPLYPFNMTGHPAVSVPAGFTADGLPVGVQLVGRWHADSALLDVAADLEAALGLDRRPALPGAYAKHPNRPDGSLRSGASEP